jgi:16S rRNA U516 pseudouridylate synthase RsuA-like enzyme
MISAVGYRVLELKRVGVGSLVLGDLPVGKWRYLTGEEVRGKAY